MLKYYSSEQERGSENLSRLILIGLNLSKMVETCPNLTMQQAMELKIVSVLFFILNENTKLTTESW